MQICKDCGEEVATDEICEDCGCCKDGCCACYEDTGPDGGE